MSFTDRVMVASLERSLLLVAMLLQAETTPRIKPATTKTALVVMNAYDDGGIRRLFNQFSRGLLQRWINVTEVAMKEQPRGFPGFKTSPAAFLVDAVQNNRLPPDWIYEHERETKRREWHQERATKIQDESATRKQYDDAKAIAVDQYLKSEEGSRRYREYHRVFHDFYRTVDPHQTDESACRATVNKIAREHVVFPDFGVWLLESRNR